MSWHYDRRAEHVKPYRVFVGEGRRRVAMRVRAISIEQALEKAEVALRRGQLPAGKSRRRAQAEE